jgi:hypothetical protein
MVYRGSLDGLRRRSFQCAESSNMKSARSALYLAAGRLRAAPSTRGPPSAVETDHSHFLRLFRTLISNN